ncbi:nickel pincer cofactor biosynthesis protein LarC [Streptomyces sp. NRRL WC-3742]|uniref:nickel pincer cofactor biosynthesis protein LarC n=1 Tax=Streptomyces sp. NRRL WC-3742 TaxID=1463934 RepID=UPI0004C8DD6B|nr:nickel pincer cofactor biosynthesis protein LarC [Streptomyces sp. NRRL WC-3742]
MICWINPFTGLAGDMLLGALLDAGAPLDEVRASIGATGLTGWELEAERVTVHGLTATSARVRVTDSATERRAAELLELAASARPEPVAALSTAALTAIAHAEGRLHGTDPAEVHLHELGGHDALVDIVGVAAALHALGVTEVVSAPLPLGTGRVRAAHGLLPCPAPATLALLEGAVVTGTDLRGETVTPTGAALLRAAGARYGPPPTMTPVATGYGAGTRVLPDRPNVVAVTLGRPQDPPGAPDPPDVHGTTLEALVTLETNLDDVTGETLAHTIARALDEGALDAWTTPAVMKKGRPAQVLHVLARPEAVGRLQALVLAETGTLGIRHTAQTRVAVPRSTRTVDVGGVPVRVKQGPFGAKAEHDDAATAAALTGLPLRVVAERARRLAEREHPEGSTEEGGTP